MDSLKKILYVSPNGYMGGAEKFVVNTVLLHQKLNQELVSSLFFSPGASVEILREHHLEPMVLSSKFKLTRPLQLLRALREIRTIVQKNKIEIIHSTMAYGHLVMSLATIGMRVKRVWFQHGPVSGKLDWLASLFPVNEIFFNSRYLEDEHFKNNPDLYRAGRTIIPLGIESGHPTAASSGKIEVLLAGRIAPGKGFHLVLKALRDWKDKKREWLESFHFTIVGAPNTPDEKVYEELLHALARDLGGLVTFKPFTKNMSELYSSSHILIQPSVIGEGFGLVLAEAMSAGLLAIGPSYGGSSEILISGETGFSVDFKSEDMRPKLEKILQNFETKREEMVKIIQNGKALIELHYSPETMMKKLEGSYEKL